MKLEEIKNLRSKELSRLREVADKATPGPWGPWTANIPFYVNVEKPAASMSKHDNERPTYWRMEDAMFVLEFNPKKVLELLDNIEELQSTIYDLCEQQDELMGAINE